MVKKAVHIGVALGQLAVKNAMSQSFILFTHAKILTQSRTAPSAGLLLLRIAGRELGVSPRRTGKGGIDRNDHTFLNNGIRKVARNRSCKKGILRRDKLSET